MTEEGGLPGREMLRQAMQLGRCAPSSRSISLRYKFCAVYFFGAAFAISSSDNISRSFPLAPLRALPPSLPQTPRPARRTMYSASLAGSGTTWLPIDPPNEPAEIMHRDAAAAIVVEQEEEGKDEALNSMACRAGNLACSPTRS